jgi:long-chain fatty acid transport protein
VGENKCVVGVGVNVPFGQSTRWEKTIPAPYFSEMITVNVNPTVAFKLGKSVSFGAGLDVYRGCTK